MRTTRFWTLLLAAAVAAAGLLAGEKLRAEDSQGAPECAKDAACPHATCPQETAAQPKVLGSVNVRWAAEETRFPVLSNIPYVGRLFKTVGYRRVLVQAAPPKEAQAKEPAAAPAPPAARSAAAGPSHPRARAILRAAPKVIRLIKNVGQGRQAVILAETDTAEDGKSKVGVTFQLKESTDKNGAIGIEAHFVDKNARPSAAPLARQGQAIEAHLASNNAKTAEPGKPKKIAVEVVQDFGFFKVFKIGSPKQAACGTAACTLAAHGSVPVASTACASAPCASAPCASAACTTAACRTAAGESTACASEKCTEHCTGTCCAQVAVKRASGECACGEECACGKTTVAAGPAKWFGFHGPLFGLPVPPPAPYIVAHPGPAPAVVVTRHVVHGGEMPFVGPQQHCPFQAMHEQLVKALTENAAHKARAELIEKLAETRSELAAFEVEAEAYEGMIEAEVELAAQEARQEALEELAELATENARLKAQAELLAEVLEMKDKHSAEMRELLTAVTKLQAEHASKLAEAKVENARLEARLELAEQTRQLQEKWANARLQTVVTELGARIELLESRQPPAHGYGTPAGFSPYPDPRSFAPPSTFLPGAVPATEKPPHTATLPAPTQDESEK